MINELDFESDKILKKENLVKKHMEEILLSQEKFEKFLLNILFTTKKIEKIKN